MKPNRMLVGAMGVLLALGTWSVAAGPAAASGSKHREHSHRQVRERSSRDAFDQAMRKLWEDHITWTRLFIVSATADLPDLQATTDRLLRNQSDIGDAIKPYYGRAAGAQLTELLRGHILTAADILSAAKAGDSAALAQAKAAWYENADQIAGFLANANPRNWKLGDMKSMMREHLDLTLSEAVAHLEGRYADDVAFYDQVHDAILEMSDMLASGIERQFPRQFTS
jgi:hypothetical protein